MVIYYHLTWPVIVTGNPHRVIHKVIMMFDLEMAQQCYRIIPVATALEVWSH